MRRVHQPVGRVLLLINEASGTGHDSGVVETLRASLAGSLGREVDAGVDVVRDHPSARQRVARVMSESGGLALVIVGGGNGTLRAAIEGACEGKGHLPAPEELRIAALRMGSGNPLARRFGATLDLEETLVTIVRNARAGRYAPCCVMRCEVGTPEGGTSVRYAATMAGLGQFGRVPGDIERWRKAVPRFRASLARVLGIEKVNAAEYIFATLLRCIRCAIWGEAAVEQVEVRLGERREVMRLLAGVVMNGPVDELPLDPGVRVEDEEIFVCLVPYSGRLSALRLVLGTRGLLRSAIRERVPRGEGLELRLLDRDRAGIFLDEDPAEFAGRLNVGVAGSVAFVPGPGYVLREEKEVHA
jgi:hypothetical protein